MPQVVGKTSAAANVVQGSKRQTYNSTKGEVLLICDEDSLSAAQKLLYSEHDEKMKVYQKALDAYNKQYGKLETANGRAGATDSQVPASLTCKGNGVVENGVVTPQQHPQPQPQPQPQQQQLKQQQPQASVLIPVGAPIKKTVLPSATWQPPIQTQLVNKTTISIPSNIVPTQQVVPRVINPVNTPAPRTVLQVPVGTDLAGMHIVNVPGSTGNYQLVVSPQVTYPTFTSSVVPRSEAPVRVTNTVPGSVQKIFVPISTSTRVTVPSASQMTNAGSAPVTTVASIQAVSVSKAPKTAEKAPITSPAVSAKRSSPTDGNKTKSKRSKSAAKSAPSPPDVEDNYYGWKQGRLWWDDEKPKGSFRCYVCNKKLPTNIRYMQHVKHHLDKEQQQNSTLNNLISCRSCYKHFSSPSALQRHIEKSHKYCEHRCGICELACDDGPSLLQHLSKHHQSLQMPYVCGVCSYASSIYDDLILHFNKHHEGSKALMCPFCVRIIRCNNAFLRHCKTHLTVSIKNGLFRCRSCKLMFLNNSMLKEHLQEDHKSHPVKERNGVPPLQTIKGKPAQAASVQKVSFPKQTSIKISPSLWTRREIIKPRGHLRCFECGMMTDVCKEHFRKKMSCNRCKYTTYCGTAFANHMIVFHKAGSAPKIHKIRKTIVNNGRILLGCRNCEFSTLSPTLMACHIESCPRGALTIESFKVRTYSLQSSRHFKREIMPVNVKTTKRDEEEDDDDDVVVIEEEVLVDLTDDSPSTSKEEKMDGPKPVPAESTTGESSQKKVGSLTIKLEKLPDDLTLSKSLLTINGKGDADQRSKETSNEASEETSKGVGQEASEDAVADEDKGVDNRRQTIDSNQPASEDEKMEVDEPANNEDRSSDGTSQKTLDTDTQSSSQDTKEPAGTVGEGKESVGNADDEDKSSEDKIEASVDKIEASVDKIEASVDNGKVVQTKELRIKKEQIDAH